MQRQPAPVRGGREVTPELLRWLRTSGFLSSELAEKLKQRYHFGLAKYGQPLMSNDGRDEIVDAEDEILDLMQYLYKARMNGRGKDLERLSAYLNVLESLMRDELRVSVVVAAGKSE